MTEKQSSAGVQRVVTLFDSKSFVILQQALYNSEDQLVAYMNSADHQSFDFDFDLPGLDGKNVALADFRGKLLIVDIWGTWCPPCRMEIPHFVELRKNYADKMDIVGINYERGAADEAVTKIQQFIDDEGVTYTCVIGDAETKDQVPEFEGFPTTLFLDAEGVVRLKVVGYHPYEKLEAIVLELLAQQKI